MNNNRHNPPIIPPGQVLPPMDAATTRQPETKAGKSKGKRRDSEGTRDRFGVLNAFVDVGMAGLTRAELATWLVLYRDTRRGTARTGANDIARRSGLSKRAVLDAVGKLRQRGLLTRIYKGGINRGPSTYRVHPLPREPP